MEVRVFKGKLGHEEGIGTITDTMLATLDYALPAKGDLIGLNDEVYKVQQVLLDYTENNEAGYEPEYCVFVKDYDWE